MKASINVEFTDEELIKYASDAGRRVGLTFIHDVIGHLGAVKAPPGFMDTIGQVLASALSKDQQVDPGPTAVAHGSDEEHELPLKRCVRITSEVPAGHLPLNPNLDEGWLCCGCRTYNGVHRVACRCCTHERCDVVVPPPPSPPPPPIDPSLQ